MKIDTLFTSFVATDMLDINSIDNAAVVSFCIQHVKEYQTSPNQNRIYDEHWSGILNPLYNSINERLAFFHKEYEFNDNLKFKISSAWTTVDSSVTISSAHCHPRSVISGVYYPLASENGGTLEFINPIPTHEWVIDNTRMIKNYNPFNGSLFWNKPKTGMIVFFPSWLQHYVKPAEEESPRISIAFDTIME
jgi:uncharacterized protein (TIGR02466 family)